MRGRGRGRRRGRRRGRGLASTAVQYGATAARTYGPVAAYTSSFPVQYRLHVRVLLRQQPTCVQKAASAASASASASGGRGRRGRISARQLLGRAGRCSIGRIEGASEGLRRGTSTCASSLGDLNKVLVQNGEESSSSSRNASGLIGFRTSSTMSSLESARMLRASEQCDEMLSTMRAWM